MAGGPQPRAREKKNQGGGGVLFGAPVPNQGRRQGPNTSTCWFGEKGRKPKGSAPKNDNLSKPGERELADSGGDGQGKEKETSGHQKGEEKKKTGGLRLGA